MADFKVVAIEFGYYQFGSVLDAIKKLHDWNPMKPRESQIGVRINARFKAKSILSTRLSRNSLLNFLSFA